MKKITISITVLLLAVSFFACSDFSNELPEPVADRSTETRAAPSMSIVGSSTFNWYNLDERGRYQPGYSSYSISNITPGATFTGWTITPSDYTTTNGTSYTTLDISFNAPFWYILKANFIMPDGTPYSIEKKVVSSPMTSNFAENLIYGPEIGVSGQVGNYYSIYNDLPPGASVYTWEIEPWSPIYWSPTYEDGTIANTGFTGGPGQYTVYVMFAFEGGGWYRVGREVTAIPATVEGF